MIEIIEVKSLKQLRSFINFQYRLYRGNPYFVPPLYYDELNTLRWDKNPAFEYCEARYWLAYRDGKIVGRIAGIHNPKYIEKWKHKHLRFGWIDFIDDREVSEKLINTVEAWARELRMDALVGPMGFTDMDKEGLLVEGFEELGTLPMIYNYPYYPEHLNALGFKKDADWLEFEIKTPAEIPEKVQRINDLVLKRSGLSLVAAKRPRDYRPFAIGIFDVINAAYSHLYGFVELTEKQKKVYINQYFSFIDPDFTKIIIDKNNKVVAFGISMPSLSRALQKAQGRLFPVGFFYLLKALKKPETIDMYLVAVDPEYQGRGINSILMTEITGSCIKRGIRTAETSGELEENKAVQDFWRYYEHRQHKRRRSFIRIL